MFYTIDKWKMSQRQWVEYPDEVLNPLTTLEETKAATCIIITSQYCEALQEKHKDSAKIIQRWKDLEIWTIDKDTLNAFIEELKTLSQESN